MLDLVHRRPAAKALQHQADQFQMIQRGHLAQRRDVREFLRQDMLRGNRLERIRRKTHIHGMARPPLEIDDNLRKKPIPIRNFPHPPTPVDSKLFLSQVS